MGKWTGEYYDDVLGAKIKSLVAGAVKRSKLDKGEPSITYESFVEDLDPGDSFTTSITELLVKEMADRRTRQAAAERRLIADRTAKGLRLLAAPNRVHRDRSVRGLLGRRASLNLTDYLAAPPEEMDMDSETDASLDSLLDPEGARLNSELHEAYASPSYVSTEHAGPYTSRARHFAARAYRTQHAQAQGHAQPTSGHDDWATWMPPSTGAGAGWSWPPAPSGPGSASLSRQPSIRRPPARSRTMDFHEFTTRRRSSTREDTSATTPQATGTPAMTTLQVTSVPPRRFFPPMRRLDLPWSQPSDAPHVPSASTSSDPHAPAQERGPSRERFSWLPPLSVASPSRSASPDAASQPPPPTAPPSAPRLRRGGVRPPESLSWHVSMVGSSQRGRDAAEDAVDGDGAQSSPPLPLPPPQPRVPYELRGLSPGADAGGAEVEE
ncbi:hypothetical protein FA95DRAFT_244359 [Auriscalpium vulgare]|uniref:Uncharacterized protein n=1 Tax=Auriscalpium vulgare TaxID=40419 RepID=A0ACB8RLV9_9AGAM|nr:hypothetical protein FA95DRAFT_244359 [Auriscalpium vulgare]